MTTRRTVWGSMAAIVAILVAVHLLGLPLRGAFQRVVSPLGISANQLAQSIEARMYHGSYPDTKSPDTQAELNRLRSRQLELEQLRAENRQLKQEITFARGETRQTVTTQVINYNPDQTRDVIRINAGSEQGVAAQMPVVAQSALVGRVVRVTATTAQVELVTDVAFRALGKVESGPEGIIKGGIGGGLTLQQLPQDPGIEAGDLVVTSGLDGVYPRGILVGSVRSVLNTPGEVLSTAQITPAVAYRDLRMVTVIQTP
ncbi:rod shape-determining protein MreC [Candidatus Saccharibacteria bacterium QS_5_54_17]|nr:MAG: rod shape-determining protein MreC [Candidatus Saccharibacteria bacterium QS_5_54_17]